MTSDIHIYRADAQPAHRWFMAMGGKRHWVKRNKRALARCRDCNKRRGLGHMWVHVYYDGVRYFCRKGFGCRR